MKWARIGIMGLAGAALVCYLLLETSCFLLLRAVFLPALALYLLSHCLRAARIFLLLYDGRLRAREALYAHIHAAGVSMLIPWKLGEIYRIFIFQGISPTFRRVLMSIWVERIWDTAALLLLLLLPVLAGINMHINGMLILYMVLFIGISAFLFLVLPENINLVKRYLIIRKRSEQALSALIWVDRFHALLTTAYRLLRYRVATMAWITCGIWGLELLALWWISLHQSRAGQVDGMPLPQELADQLSSPVPWLGPGALSTSTFSAYHLCEVQIVVLCALLASWPVLLVALRRYRAHREQPSAMLLQGLALSSTRKT